MAILEAGGDGVAAGHLLHKAFVQRCALIALFQCDEAGTFQAGHIAACRAGGAAAGTGDGIGLGVHAVVAQHFCQRFEEGAFAVGAVAVQEKIMHCSRVEPHRQ